MSSVNVGGENPEADPGCGFSMGLVVDSSGSIDDGGQADEDAVKAVVIALLTQLEGTGVEVSLIDFDTNATVIFQPTVASAALTADTLPNWNYNADEFTNWQDALQTQRTDLNDYNSGPEGEPSSVPDFVLFFTDGAPTVRIGATGGVTDSDGLNLTLAVVEANLLKAAGARMLGIGVGGVTDDVANINRLKAVTGPVQSVGTPDPLTDDLIITDFDRLTTGFQELALSLCGSSLTILKEVPDGQGGWESAQSWEFTADVAMSTGGANDYEWELPDPGATAGDPVTESTNANGIVTYQWQPDNPPTGADVSVEETIQPGYAMVSVDCEETRLDGDDYDVVVNNLDLDAGTFDIELTNGSIGKCTVRNEPEPDEPELTLDKTSTTANYDSVGDVINYEYELTNSGNVPLTPPYAVVDDKATVTCPQVPNPLNPGASITCTASYIVTQADLNNGEVINTAQGSAEFEGDPIESNEDEETVPADQEPELTLDKTSTTANYDSVGDVINYEYELTNSGNVALTPPYAVTDDKTTVTCPQVPILLVPGASITCTASYIVTQDDLNNGEVVNTAQGSAEFDGDPVESNEDDATVPAVQDPELTLDKTTTTLNYDSIGDVINYEYELTNSGNVALLPTYSVADDKATVTCPQVPSPLNPGASITCTASYIVTPADMVNGSVTNVAQSTAFHNDSPVNSNEDEVTVPRVTTPPSGNCDLEASNNQWTDILGVGMGNPKAHKNLAKVLIPNAADVLFLYGQLAGKEEGLVKNVRFIYPNNTFVQTNIQTSPAPIHSGVFWYGTELTPSNHIRGRWFLQTSGAKKHIPRALVIYPTYESEGDEYVNVFETLDTSDTQVYWDILGGWVPSRQIIINIPAPLAPSTFHVKLAMVDNDADVRPVYLTVTAGGVSQTVQPTGPNRKDQLNIIEFTLANVPAGTGQIVIDLVSPAPGVNGLGPLGGDSVALTGVTANYECVDLGN